MRKTIIIITLLLLTSCWLPTDEEIAEYKRVCEMWWEKLKYSLNGYWEILTRCYNPVEDCIKEYTEGIDQKYNNPDTVTNLREDNYSEVVKTCNDIFWD